MKQLQVELKDNTYSIHINQGILDHVASQIGPASQFAIITNETIAPLYLQRLETQFPAASCLSIILPDGEPTKSLSDYEMVMTQLLEAGYNRNSVLIALGGGVVGDLTGFVAATLHRGCRFVQVPTTLLAQVDSSVGGKTGINHAIGKNLIGAFYQPEVVLIDPESLSSLDRRQFNSGMAEVIKYGFLEDPHFIPWLVEQRDAIKSLVPDVVAQMIQHCCQVKAQVVASDEKEQGQRALLNFGHTFGHAIEQVLGYGDWLHGEAVALGMLMACRLAIKEGICEQSLYNDLHDLIEYFQLPTTLEGNHEAEILTKAMLKDKKNINQCLRLVLPHRLGKSAIHEWSDLDTISQLWREFGAQ